MVESRAGGGEGSECVMGTERQFRKMRDVLEGASGDSGMTS